MEALPKTYHSKGCVSLHRGLTHSSELQFSDDEYRFCSNKVNPVEGRRPLVNVFATEEPVSYLVSIYLPIKKAR